VVCDTMAFLCSIVATCFLIDARSKRFRRPRPRPGPPCPVPSRPGRGKKGNRNRWLVQFKSEKETKSKRIRDAWMDHAFVHLLSFPVRRASQSIRSDDQTFPIDQSVRVRETRVLVLDSMHVIWRRKFTHKPESEGGWMDRWVRTLDVSLSRTMHERRPTQ
jgi:hypothetical protein